MTLAGMKEDDSQWFWDGKFFNTWEDIDPYDFQKTVLEFLPETVFHIGQSYENKVAETYRCKRCGGTEFNVGKGSYFTAIKCVKCLWESCVHEG